MNAEREWRSPSRRQQSSFTLIELLVAAALTVAIAALALSLMANALTRWNRAQGSLTTEGQARTVLDQLALDLQSACHRDDGQVWLAATVQADTSASGAWINGGKPVAGSLEPAATDLAEARFGRAGVWLRFFTAAGRGRQPAAPVADAYQIVRRAPTPAGHACHYLLYRSEVGAAETFAAGYDISGPSYAEPGTAGGSVAVPGLRQVLAENVVDFGVRFLAAATDPATGRPVIQPVFPLNRADLEYRAGARDPAEVRRAFPDIVDVMVRVLTDDGARQIAALEAGQLGGDWWSIALAHSRVLTRRVRVRTNPT